eukprot:752605-Hanusia_phi.AAC.3
MAPRRYSARSYRSTGARTRGPGAEPRRLGTRPLRLSQIGPSSPTPGTWNLTWPGSPGVTRAAGRPGGPARRGR